MSYIFPLVSVIIPTFKRAVMLPRAIDSVLNQTYKNIEILIIDDNDPDTDWRKKTSLLMQHYSLADNIRYICHEKNMNGSVARNTGIRNAKGDFVAFLDDDDVYLPTKIEKQVNYLLSHTKYRAVYCGWDRDGIVIPDKEGDLSCDLLSGVNLVYTNTIMMWKKDALLCGWDENLKRHQEAGFLLRYFRNNGKIGVVSENLVKFDISDRTNAAKNGKIHEKQTLFYLKSYSDMIKKCEKEKKGAKKYIYTYRYRGILLSYLKCHEILGALKIYFTAVLKMPIRFNKALIDYAIQYFRR